jgi:hypothetical protein
MMMYGSMTKDSILKTLTMIYGRILSSYRFQVTLQKLAWEAKRVFIGVFEKQILSGHYFLQATRIADSKENQIKGFKDVLEKRSLKQEHPPPPAYP